MLCSDCLLHSLHTWEGKGLHAVMLMLTLASINYNMHWTSLLLFFKASASCQYQACINKALRTSALEIEQTSLAYKFIKKIFWAVIPAFLQAPLVLGQKWLTFHAKLVFVRTLSTRFEYLAHFGVNQES